jgi:hypothetical protein
LQDFEYEKGTNRNQGLLSPLSWTPTTPVPSKALAGTEIHLNAKGNYVEPVRGDCFTFE